jgi:hypothetical protein
MSFGRQRKNSDNNATTTLLDGFFLITQYSMSVNTEKTTVSP